MILKLEESTLRDLEKKYIEAWKQYMFRIKHLNILNAKIDELKKEWKIVTEENTTSLYSCIFSKAMDNISSIYPTDINEVPAVKEAQEMYEILLDIEIDMEMSK